MCVTTGDKAIQSFLLERWYCISFLQGVITLLIKRRKKVKRESLRVHAPVQVEEDRIPPLTVTEERIVDAIGEDLVVQAVKAE